MRQSTGNVKLKKLKEDHDQDPHVGRVGRVGRPQTNVKVHAPS